MSNTTLQPIINEVTGFPVILPQNFFRDPRYDNDTLGVLGYLLSHAPGWRIEPSDIQRKRGMGRDRVRKTLKKLVDMGILIAPQKYRDEQGQWQYTPYKLAVSFNLSFSRATESPPKATKDDNDRVLKSSHRKPVTGDQSPETRHHKIDTRSNVQEEKEKQSDKSDSVSLDMSNILEVFKLAFEAHQKQEREAQIAKEERWNAFWDEIEDKLKKSGHDVTLKATKGLIGKIRIKMADNGLEPSDVADFMRYVYRAQKQKTGQPPEISCYLWNTYYAEWSRNDQSEPDEFMDDTPPLEEKYMGIPIWLLKLDYPDLYAEYLASKGEAHEHQPTT